MKEQMTYHVQVQRADRVQHIINDIGLGQIIKEKYTRYNIGEPGRWVCLTDTGITIIKSEDKKRQFPNPKGRNNTMAKTLIAYGDETGSS